MQPSVSLLLKINNRNRAELQIMRLRALHRKCHQRKSGAIRNVVCGRREIRRRRRFVEPTASIIRWRALCGFDARAVNSDRSGRVSL